MEYKIIDKNIWKRREYFENYFSVNPCTYSLTTKLDITNVRKKGLKLYPTMLYTLTKAVNKYEEFRMTLRGDGEVVLFKNMEPCYTVFHKETETFSNLWTEYAEDYDVFCANYETDIEKYGKIEGFIGKPNIPANSFNISMIPWTTFD